MILLNVLAFLVECKVFVPAILLNVYVNPVVCLLFEPVRLLTFFSVLPLDKISLLEPLTLLSLWPTPDFAALPMLT